MGKAKTTRSGSIFWAIILIAVGAIWLLGNVGVLSFANLSVLLRLWPLALIVFVASVLVPVLKISVKDSDR